MEYIWQHLITSTFEGLLLTSKSLSTNAELLCVVSVIAFLFSIEKISLYKQVYWGGNRIP